MKKINLSSINAYLKNSCRIEDINQLFDEGVATQRRDSLINKLFHHFTNHHMESGILMAEHNATSHISAYYHEYNSFNHLETPEELIAELKAAQDVTQSLHNFHQRLLLHRNKVRSRYLKELNHSSTHQQER